MLSNEPDVATYIQEVPADRQHAMHELRRLCRSVLAGFDEITAYGGHCYSRNGVIEVGFASLKHFIGLYILRPDALESRLPCLNCLSVGKGCIRYPRPGGIDFAVVERLLAATRDSTGEVCCTSTSRHREAP